ncbi:MAG: hypothetical protein GY855_05240, partial [candidate division Zixibacteria bacterium]|nr:hypothetical protein [candidate division Zixibacteria bacterium]
MIEYYGYLYNLTEFPFTADVWIELVYPDTTRINLRHWYDVTAESGTNEWYVTQYVPYTVPLGIYQYWAYCGDYDNRIIDDSCFFPFMVVL